MKPILYFAQTCPDTAPFKEKLAKLGIEYDEVEVLTSLRNLKQFLFIRDTYKVFENVHGKMQIGIPALVVSENECILNIDELEKLAK